MVELCNSFESQESEYYAMISQLITDNSRNNFLFNAIK